MNNECTMQENSFFAKKMQFANKKTGNADDRLSLEEAEID